MRDLETLGGNYSHALGVNDRGDVVGWSLNASGEHHAFLWTERDGMVDLGSLWEQSAARGINNAGVIAGWSNTESGQIVAVRWTAH